MMERMSSDGEDRLFTSDERNVFSHEEELREVTLTCHFPSDVISLCQD